MEKKQMEEYSSKKEEIKELKYKLEHLSEDESMMGCDVILDYRSGYPVPQSVVGVDWKKVNKRAKRYEARIIKLQEECQEIEEFIENIEDSRMRRIFRMRYVDGMSQMSVAIKMHMDQSSVSKKINQYFKVE